MRREALNPDMKFTSASTPPGRWIETFEISLLTPMVGGGIKSYQLDQGNPIRTSGIKNQLRFWWRAIQDPTTTKKDLLKAETDLFGDGKTKASTVRLSVVSKAPQCDQIVTIKPSRHRTDYQGLPPYVLFPIGQINEQEVTLLKQNYSFELTVDCRAQDKKLIRNLLTLWILFGGIGARTRRGCGSVECSRLTDRFATAESVGKFLTNLNVAGADDHDFPSLHGSVLAMRDLDHNADAIESWKSLIDVFFEFRQGTGYGRDGTPDDPGRSFWPESDSIRNIDRGPHPAGRYNHEVNHPSALNNNQFYPRAAYGMPILFRFHPDDRDDPKGTYTLAPAGKKRWPSPIILKVARVGGHLKMIYLQLNQSVPDVCMNNEPIINQDNRAHPTNSGALSIMSKNPAPGNNTENPLLFLFSHLLIDHAFQSIDY